MQRLFLLAFIWGWSFLFIKVILEDAPPTFLAWGRIALGLAVLAVAMRHRSERLPERRYWGHLLVLGLALCCVAVEGGGPIVRSSGNLPGVAAICRAGALRSAHVADRDGSVCCWWPWRGGSSAPLASAS